MWWWRERGQRVPLQWRTRALPTPSRLPSSLRPLFSQVSASRPEDSEAKMGAHSPCERQSGTDGDMSHVGTRVAAAALRPGPDLHRAFTYPDKRHRGRPMAPRHWGWGVAGRTLQKSGQRQTQTCWGRRRSVSSRHLDSGKEQRELRWRGHSTRPSRPCRCGRHHACPGTTLRGAGLSENIPRLGGPPPGRRLQTKPLHRPPPAQPAWPPPPTATCAWHFRSLILPFLLASSGTF